MKNHEERHDWWCGWMLDDDAGYEIHQLIAADVAVDTVVGNVLYYFAERCVGFPVLDVVVGEFYHFLHSC